MLEEVNYTKNPLGMLSYRVVPNHCVNFTSLVP